MSQSAKPFSPAGIWELAWPAIVGNLLYSTVNLIDTKIVGALGAPAVAALTTGHRIFFVLQAVLMAVTAGTAALVARAWGAGNHDEAARVTGASLVVCLGVALVATIPGVFFARELAGIFRLDEETLGLATTYIRWISVFNVAFAVAFSVGAALRAAGDTMTPLWIGAVTNVVNVFLAYGLVFGRFGFPELGVAGAAIAGGSAFGVGAVISVALWIGGGLRIPFHPGGAVSGSRIRQLLHIGYPAGLEQGAFQGGFIAFLWIVALYGTEPYAAYGIGVTILSFSFVVGFGFSIAASTLVGQHLGAGDPQGAARSGWRAVRMAMLAMALLGISIVLGSHWIASMLIEDAEVIRLTVVFIYILGAVQPLMAIEFTLGGALRGAGDTRFPMITVMTGLLGVRITIASAFTWLGLSVEWVYAALIFDYIVKSTMLTLRFRSGRWQTAIATPERAAA
ncbi:MAG: MATE family efflux transporter [Myxococcota bacterium]